MPSLGSPPRGSEPWTAGPRSGTPVALGLKLLGANPAARVTGGEELPGKANYFIGNNPGKWHTNVPTYARVKYHGVYPGVDLVFYGNQQQLEHDFVVSPGADARRIAFRVEGSKEVSLDAEGNLVMAVEGGEVCFQRPLIYQESRGVRREIPGGYVLRGAREVAFKVGTYDPTRPLVIDPVLAYSTYLGGSSDNIGTAIAVDSSGHAYVTGYTISLDFPTTKGAFQTKYSEDDYDAFVTKLNPWGSALLYSTYLGGNGSDTSQGIAVDAWGNAYVTGATSSSDFPTTERAFQTTKVGSFDTFVTKLNPWGSALVYSTFLGGSYDTANAIAVDLWGSAYVTGETTSSNFPTTKGAIQTTYRGGYDAFVTKLNPRGSALVYSTFLGGSKYDSGYGIALDPSGDAYVTGYTGSNDFPTTEGAFQRTYSGGYEVFVTKLNLRGALVYSTYLGGSGTGTGNAIAVDSSGHAYVTGQASSGNLPTTEGAFQTTCAGDFDTFVTKLDRSGSALLYSTYLGGNDSDTGNGVAVDAWGNAYVTGFTMSGNFPTTGGGVQTTNRGYRNAFVTTLNPRGSALVYSTYLGGSSYDLGLGIALDPWGIAYVTGFTTSINFPTTEGAFQTSPPGYRNAFVAKLAITPQAQIANLENTVKGLVSARTLNPGAGLSLLAPLKEALASLDHGRASGAILELNAFVNDVRLLINRHALGTSEGKSLMDAAESIIAALRA